jgi:hypothetical protein
LTSSILYLDSLSLSLSLSVSLGAQPTNFGGGLSGWFSRLMGGTAGAGAGINIFYDFLFFITFFCYFIVVA